MKITFNIGRANYYQFYKKNYFKVHVSPLYGHLAYMNECIKDIYSNRIVTSNKQFHCNKRYSTGALLNLLSS